MVKIGIILASERFILKFAKKNVLMFLYNYFYIKLYISWICGKAGLANNLLVLVPYFPDVFFRHAFLCSSRLWQAYTEISHRIEIKHFPAVNFTFRAL